MKSLTFLQNYFWQATNVVNVEAFNFSIFVINYPFSKEWLKRFFSLHNFTTDETNKKWN